MFLKAIPVITCTYVIRAPLSRYVKSLNVRPTNLESTTRYRDEANVSQSRAARRTERNMQRYTGDSGSASSQGRTHGQAGGGGSASSQDRPWQRR